MSRARNIKPGFYKNEDLAECSVWARFIFPGLWMLADREGRLEDRPKRIKAELLAFDSQDVEPLLVELAARGFLVRYRNADGSFIQITKFLTHQSPHYSEKKSVIKAPALPEIAASICAEIPGALPEVSGKVVHIKRGSQPPDSLNPDSLNPDTGEKPKHVQQAARFDAFWAVYPNKKARKAALRHWQTQKLDPLTDQIIAHVRRMIAEDDDWKRGYVPIGSTYVNGERWTDEPCGPRTNNTAAPSKTTQTLEALDELARA